MEESFLESVVADSLLCELESGWKEWTASSKLACRGVEATLADDPVPGCLTIPKFLLQSII